MVETPQFDSLVQGNGYASVPTPTSDAAELTAVAGNTLDSINDSPTATVVSVATYDVNAPLTGAFLESNLHPDNYLNPEKPIF